MSKISRRAYEVQSIANSWEEIWEAASYYERISECLEASASYAIFVGWQVDSRLPMPRAVRFGQDEREQLKNKLIRLCEERPDFQVYFLIWDHAYFYSLEREAMQGRVWDELHERIHFVFDNRYLYGASHHEKVAIFDGNIAFCGGIDLCDERWDSREHLFSDSRRSLDWLKEHHGPYHDLAVQVTGPVCREIQNHVAARWKILSSVPIPQPTPGRSAETAPDKHVVYLSRTIAQNESGGTKDRGISITREIEFLVQSLITQAEHRIIMEGQYYWSEKFNDLLIAKIHEIKKDAQRPFEIYLILADTRDFTALTKTMATHQMRLLSKLQIAAKFSGTKLFVGFPYVTDGTQHKSIYVHSKVILIDDQFFSIGSANLAARAFRVDTELNLTLEACSDAERGYVSEVGERILTHWNFDKTGPATGVQIRILDCEAELRRIEAENPFLKHIPWGLFFDPIVPWFYPLHRHYRHWSSTRAGSSFLFLIFVWVSSVVTTFWMFRLIQAFAPLPPSSHEHLRWISIYGALLSSVWIIPVPFMSLSLFSALHLGGDTGAGVSVAALWSTASWSYVVSRLYPEAALRFFKFTAPAGLSKTQNPRLRSFPKLLHVLADPRISIRTKLVSQGLNYVHLPWFVLGTIIVLPSAIYLADTLVAQIHHGNSSRGIEEFAPIAAGAALLWALACTVLRLIRQRRPEESPEELQ